jgi:hypothetical protein
LLITVALAVIDNDPGSQFVSDRARCLFNGLRERGGGEPSHIPRSTDGLNPS